MSANFAKWHPVRSNPLPSESDIIARAQSMQTRGGKVARPLPYREALRVVMDSDRLDTTSPEPLRASQRH